MNRRTEAQKLASRINGAKSRGPVTPEGKQRVSRNAVKLGIHARRAVLANENPEAWEALLQALKELWQTENIEELRLVHQIAARCRRITPTVLGPNAETETRPLKLRDTKPSYGR